MQVDVEVGVEEGVEEEEVVVEVVQVELVAGLEVGSTTPSTCSGQGGSCTMAVPLRLLVLLPTTVMLMSGVGPSTWYLAGGCGGGGGAPRGAGGEGGRGGGEGRGGEGGGGGERLRAAVTSSWWSTSAAEVLEVEGLEFSSRPLEVPSGTVAAVLPSG